MQTVQAIRIVDLFTLTRTNVQKPQPPTNTSGKVLIYKYPPLRLTGGSLSQGMLTLTVYVPSSELRFCSVSARPARAASPTHLSVRFPKEGEEEKIYVTYRVLGVCVVHVCRRAR